MAGRLPLSSSGSNASGSDLSSAQRRALPTDRRLRVVAQMLDPAGRALVEAVLLEGVPVESVALELGIGADRLEQELVHLVRRVSSPTVSALVDAWPELGPLDRLLASAELQGLTPRQIASRTGGDEAVIARRRDLFREKLGLVTDSTPSHVPQDR